MEISRQNQTKRRRSHYSGSRLRARNLAKQLDFTMYGGLSLVPTSSSSSPDHFRSLAKPNLELQISPPIPLLTVKMESSVSQPQAYTGKDYYATPEPQKQCRCKQTKCLKLYCECFASEVNCNGCNCVDCHNNIENESERNAAVERILRRKPNAFRRKIANSPCITPDVKKEDTPLVQNQKRRCHCKKTLCLKRYCECFQADMLCSEDCKCLDCKNYDGSQERLVFFRRDRSDFRRDRFDAKTYLRKANATAAAAIQSSGYRFSLVSSKKEVQEPFGSNDKNTPVQVKSVITSGSPPAFSASPLGYRSLLAGIPNPDSMRYFCSALVVASDAIRAGIDVWNKENTWTLPGVNSFTLKKPAVEENGRAALRRLKKKENFQNLPGVQEEIVPDDHLKENVDTINAKFFKPANVNGQKGMQLSPGASALICDGKITQLVEVASPDKNLKLGDNANIYMEQERLVLTNFRDFLKKIISCGNMKAEASTWSQLEHVGNGIKN